MKITKNILYVLLPTWTIYRNLMFL
jgi:hypothetical protein